MDTAAIPSTDAATLKKESIKKESTAKVENALKHNDTPSKNTVVPDEACKNPATKPPPPQSSDTTSKQTDKPKRRFAKTRRVAAAIKKYFTLHDARKNKSADAAKPVDDDDTHEIDLELERMVNQYMPPGLFVLFSLSLLWIAACRPVPGRHQWH